MSLVDKSGRREFVGATLPLHTKGLARLGTCG